MGRVGMKANLVFSIAEGYTVTDRGNLLVPSISLRHWTIGFLLPSALRIVFTSIGRK